MVAEFQVTSVKNIKKAEPVNAGTTMTGSQSVGIDIILDEDRAVEALGLESFAADWESGADSIYDDFLKDADLR